MTKQFDHQFEKVSTLTWLPWVGENYPTVSLENRALIIGESHYYEPKEGTSSLEKHQEKNYTRKVINDVAIGREYRIYSNGAAKIFPNFHRTIFSNDTFDSKLLWENISFCNLIQDPMRTKLARPKALDYEKGWINLIAVIDILRPTTCIFLGTSCTNFFPSIFPHQITIQSGLSDDGWVNSTASKKATLEMLNGQEVKLKFIKHPSCYYSWPQWHSHLKEKHGDLITWLTTSVLKENGFTNHI